MYHSRPVAKAAKISHAAPRTGYYSKPINAVKATGAPLLWPVIIPTEERDSKKERGACGLVVKTVGMCGAGVSGQRRTCIF
ncbi:MAG: hypothetical protein A3D59_00765 [Candidatus Wildermuthbacteria bacterium RIFCSPHIGHO2_02_FULL_47_17]|uniref:Uncharacterized protein n=1 Tax=Candidatus Wildermuthbacteria bacterium RIFCSPHIGHO2_02_FULL_47_17 TaxID=1802452 RepID=A0A1G2R6Q0_9BACT|nr:MAG: hypothetical protein A3D59_00765 [Candidatus Wildermuthbacteria bacterium RIFCSPHIGHO2_02_FULL_47_17]